MAELTMVKICYGLASVWEMVIGMVIVRKICPEFRFKHQGIRFLALMLLISSVFFYVWNQWLFFISTSYCLFLGVLMSLIYAIFWKADYLQLLLFWFFYYINLSIFKFPVITIRGILSTEKGINILLINRGPRILEEAVYMLLIMTLICIGLKCSKNSEIILQKLFKDNLGLCGLVVGLEWMMLCYCMNNNVEGFRRIDLTLNLIIIVCVAVLMISVTLFFAYQQVKTESILHQEIHKCLKTQYYEMKELYESNSRWMHDMKHELLFVGNCLKDNDFSGAHSSIQRYLHRIMLVEKKVWSNFTFLDFMLNYKKAEMDRHHVEFILDIELQHISIPEEELVIIIGNLLDNAIEAAYKCEEKDRKIRLKIHNLNEMLLLSIENSISQMPVVKKGIFVSTKEDKDSHGWGIQSVKRIAEHYNGEINFQYDEKYFQVNILI